MCKFLMFVVTSKVLGIGAIFAVLVIVMTVWWISCQQKGNDTDLLWTKTLFSDIDLNHWSGSSYLDAGH